PTVQDLARAKPAAVLAAWSGLGYYRRARALHEAARQVARSARFPRSSEEWRRLPGVGRYTAAAVASIAFGEPCAVVDGNVERVYARMFGTTGENAWELASQLLSPTRPGDFNQAMMEVGATVCLPRAPVCHACPAAGDCNGRGQIARPSPQPRVKREIGFELWHRGNAVRLVKRPASSSLMANMWELPAVAVNAAKPPLIQVRHSITNTDYRVFVYDANGRKRTTSGRWVSARRMTQLPMTGLTLKILRRLDII
ncbi:MAG: A/G-specific adenine glycosylase, partial [Acidobacteria bacterium]|nr:A/G-specific adenine glycosylase [Acidobacteriota bacterium]